MRAIPVEPSFRSFVTRMFGEDGRRWLETLPALTEELAGPLGRHHRYHAVRGHLHEMAGDRASAAEEYRAAAKYATNIPEKRYLERKLAALRTELEQLLRKATPAGKVYAADLLNKLDPDTGRKAWHRLAGDLAAVSTFSGCIMGQTTLAEYAAAQLGSA